MSIKEWNPSMEAQQALSLEKGTLVGDFDGMPVEQTVQPRWTITAAEAYKQKAEQRSFYSQADLVAAAQEDGLCFQDFVARLQSC